MDLSTGNIESHSQHTSTCSLHRKTMGTRFLEAAAIYHLILVFLLGGYGMLMVSVYVLLFTRYYWVIILYAIWYVIDWKTPERGGRPKSFAAFLSVWKWFINYFPMRLHKTVDIMPDRDYIFGVHPHGIMAFGNFVNFCTEATGFSEKFPGLTPHVAILSGHFQFPFYREYLMLGRFVASSEKSISYILDSRQKGNVIALSVGGAREALESRPGHKYKILLKRRKGFVKMALKHG